MNTTLITLAALATFWAIMATRANNRLREKANQYNHKMRLAQKRLDAMKVNVKDLYATEFMIDRNDVSCHVIGLCRAADGSSARVNIKRFAHQDQELNQKLAEETLDNLKEQL